MAVEGEIFRATAHYVQPNSSAIQNVFYWVYHGSSTANSNILDALEAWFTNVWGADWDDLASTDVLLDEVTVQRVDVDGSVFSNLGTIAIAVAGTVTEDVEPSAVSGFIQADTSMAGHKGRKYVPGIPEGSIVDSLFTAAAVVDLAILLADWVAEITGVGPGSLEPVIVSRTLLQVIPLLDSGSASSIPAYQRRRKPNVGS